jgi:hypothetical protein
MPRKKSVKLAAQTFVAGTQAIEAFLQETSGLKAESRYWCTEFAIIRLYQEFEALILSAIVGAINNDTTTLSLSVGLNFPKHLSQDVCTFLIFKGGYFDFKGRDGLIDILKDFVPDNHYLPLIIRDQKYKPALEKLSAFRNFAAHPRSQKAKKAAVRAIGGGNLGSAGGWLSRQGRFKNISDSMVALAHEIEAKAPY